MDVKLPSLGENAEGGSVVSILVKEGDMVSAGQTILELENEKAVAPIASSASGVVSNIRVKEGDRLSVGQVILSVTEGAGSSAATPAAEAQKSAPRPAAPETKGRSERESPAAPAAAEEPEAPANGPRPAASPEIRRIARELGIDLRGVRGSESGGRIVMADLRSYVQRLQKLAAQPKTVAPASKPATPVAEPIDFSKWGEVSKQPLSPLRQTISRRMLENWNSIPHVTQFDEADITGLMELRKKFAPEYEKKGVRLTLTSFALQAVAAVLKKHPVFNSSLDEVAGELVTKKYYHIGLAVDTEQGLIVPVIRDVDRKSLFQLSKEVSEFAEKARDRKVSLDEMKGGTFTISNQGGIGCGHFTPIVNKPEVAILGLGKGALKAVPREGRVESRLMLPLAVSYDHRVIDGGAAARFTVDLVGAFQGFSEADVKL
jgi:pyruvate dehydrogenase E2 component (dihydrolipoyllysine-residue acetyltransferase)